MSAWRNHMSPKTFCWTLLIGAALFAFVGMTGCESRPFTKKNADRSVRSAVKPKAKPLEAKACPVEVKAAAVAPAAQPAETKAAAVAPAAQPAEAKAAQPAKKPNEPKVEKDAGTRELDELLNLE